MNRGWRVRPFGIDAGDDNERGSKRAEVTP